MENMLKLCVTLLAALAAFPAGSQSYPSRAIRLVVPYPPGGGVDITARVLGMKLSELCGQPVLTENRPGAAGTVGADYVAKSAPDGYTLLVGGRGPISAAPLMFPNLPYVPARDLAPVTNLVMWPYILVAHPSVPASNARELITLARARPGQFNMASGGTGTGQHIAGELFNLMAGTKMTHVPYKGTAPAITDIIGRHADLGFLDPAVIPQIRSRRLKALGVSSSTRYAPLPEAPPINESGLRGYAAITWYGLMAPAATPAAVIARLSADVERALTDPEVRSKYLAQGLIASPGTPRQLGAMIKDDGEKLQKLIEDTGIRLN